MTHKVDSTVVYSLVTRPLIVAVKEMADWGFLKEEIREELRYALEKGWSDAKGSESKTACGH